MLPTEESFIAESGCEQKEKKCKFYSLNRWCRYGNSCVFKHERCTNRPSVQNHISTNDYKASSYANRQDTTEFKSEFRRRPPNSSQRHDFQSNLQQEDVNSLSNRNFNRRSKEADNTRYCRFYIQNSWCPFGIECRYVHPPPRFLSWRGNRSSADPQLGSNKVRRSPLRCNDSESCGNRRVCVYYRQGKCKYDQKCRYEHVLEAQQESREVGETSTLNTSDNVNAGEENVDEKTPTKVKAEPLGVMPHINDLSSAQLQKLRDVEITQLKKRFTKDKIFEYDSGDKFTIVVASTDPDWPFDVKDVALVVSVPCEYPKECLVIEVDYTRNELLPIGLQRHLSNVIKTWLQLKHEANLEAGRVELIFRPFLRWFDRSLEEHFTLGLKKAKRDKEAEEAGLEFVPFENLPGSQIISENIPNADDCSVKSAESAIILEAATTAKDNGDLASGQVRQKADEMVPVNQFVKVVKKGTEIKFCNMQLGENVASIHCQKLCITVACSKCKTNQDISTGPRRKNVFSCVKCHNSQQLIFRPNLVHQLNTVVGYIDVEQCQAFDLPLVNCIFSVTCLSCNKEMSSDGFHYGKAWQSWCHSCNAKLTISVESMKFQILQPNSVIGNGPMHVIRLEKKDKKVKDPSIQEGNPLPSKGTCKHYKKSFRWFRFPCCGKAYPCDLCHNEKELDHEMKMANRIICGFCAKEQPILTNKPCISCASSMIKLAKVYWEGGKGCRDKTKMSRDDNHKYVGTSKTVSRKAAEKDKSKKKTTKPQQT